MLMQIWQCIRCKTKRSWGSGPYNVVEYSKYDPRLTCASCGGPTRHKFVELNLDSYLHTYNEALGMMP